MIPSEETSTLQIGSVAFPPGQYTSPQLHPCHKLFDQDGHQDAHAKGLPWGLPEVVGTAKQVHCSRRKLLRRGLEFILSIKVPIRKKSGNLFNDPRRIDR